jgi:hypothetical protein
MKLSRRTLIKAAGVVTATSGASVAVMAKAQSQLVVFDSRKAASRNFATLHVASRIDVAKEDVHFWRSLRSAREYNRIVGATAWSDWVIVRGFLEESGKRLVREEQRGDVFLWEMA